MLKEIGILLLQGANMFNYRRLSSQLLSLKNLYELLRPYAIGSRYTPEEETILNKYDKFPKMFNNIFKDLKVRTIVDQKGNGWFEVNIPSNILNMQLQYKKGGKI